MPHPPLPPRPVVAAGDGGYRRSNAEKRPEDVWKGTYHEEGAFLYNEWDHRIEDTRAALLEAKHAGIHPFCITIDNEARDYLPHMYGAVNWALVDDVKNCR